MFAPRNLMVAGVVLIAVALGSSGHGVWWVFGLLWVLPHAAGRSHGCGGPARRAHHCGLPQAEPASMQPAPGQPDPTQDRHEAFPGR